MLPGAYSEDESEPLGATVAVNYSLEEEEEYEVAEDFVTIGISRPLFGLRHCAPFVRPTNPKQAYFVGVVDVCLAFSIALPPILGFALSWEAQVFEACWVGMRFAGYWFFRNDTTPVLRYRCAAYEQRLNAVVPKKMQVVPFTWPMTVCQSYIAGVFDVPFFLGWLGMFAWFYVVGTHQFEPPPSRWPWFFVPFMTVVLFHVFWMVHRLVAYSFMWRPTYR